MVVLGAGGEAEPRQGDQPGKKTFAMPHRWRTLKRCFTSVDALNPRFMAANTPNLKGKAERSGRSAVQGDPSLSAAVKKSQQLKV